MSEFKTYLFFQLDKSRLEIAKAQAMIELVENVFCTSDLNIDNKEEFIIDINKLKFKIDNIAYYIEEFRHF